MIINTSTKTILGPFNSLTKTFFKIKHLTSFFFLFFFLKRDVQKIALFDMRFVNTDRNDANILVKKKKWFYIIKKMNK